MWIQIGGLVVAFLGVAVSANWLGHGLHVRRVGKIRGEAELLALLPDGEVQARLLAKVERDVTTHLRLAENADLVRWLRTAKALFAAVFVDLLGTIGAWFAVIWTGDSWAKTTSAVGLAIALVLAAALKLIERLLKGRWEELFPEVPWESLGT